MISVFYRMYKIPASGWGMLAGTIAGLSFNVIMEISQLDRTVEPILPLLLSFAFILLSAIFFAVVSALIEEARENCSAAEFFLSVTDKGLGRRLSCLLFLAASFLFAGLYFLF